MNPLLIVGWVVVVVAGFGSTWLSLTIMSMAVAIKDKAVGAFSGILALLAALFYYFAWAYSPFQIVATV